MVTPSLVFFLAKVLAMTKQAMQKAQFTLEVLERLLSIRDIPKADNAK